jgi:hypothetical protein
VISENAKNSVTLHKISYAQFLFKIFTPKILEFDLFSIKKSFVQKKSRFREIKGKVYSTDNKKLVEKNLVFGNRNKFSANRFKSFGNKKFVFGNKII